MSRDSLVRVFVQVVKRTPLSRGTARRWTLGLIKSMHPEPIESDFRGVPLLFHLDNTTEKKALVSDGYDKAELNFLLGFLQNQPGTFIDIGANSGLYTIFLASHMPAGSRVIAVEPNPVMCERIVLNAALLRKRGLARGVTIDIEESALSDEDGELHLELAHGLGPALLQEHGTETSVPVPVQTFPAVCQKLRIEEIQAIKIDVEGHEDRVLLPFFAGAKAHSLPRALVLESVHKSAWKNDVIAVCAELGYQIAGQTRSSLLMRLHR